MAVQRWKGSSQAVAQVVTVTVGGTPAGGQVYSVVMGLNSSKTVSYTATGGDTNPTIATALAALLAASTLGEFREVAWTVNGAVITGTGRTAGYPFSNTSSATGTGTLVTATPTAASGPNFWSNAANWSGNAVPIAGDDVYLENSTVSVLYDLAQSAVALNSLNIASTFTGTIGLAETNGNGYLEYRSQYLAVGATTVSIGDGNSQGLGSGRIKLDSGTGATTLTVRLTGQPLEQTVESLQWKGTNVANVVNLMRGTMAIAGYDGETATVATLNLTYISSQQSDATCRCGPGCTLTTIYQEGGSLTINSAVTTLTKTAGSTVVKGTGAVTTIVADGGTLTWMTSGTLTDLTIGNGATFDRSQDRRACTVTNATILAGGAILDPGGVVTWANGILLSRCDVASVSLTLGFDRVLTPS